MSKPGATAVVEKYYDDGTCVIYHGDCRDVLPSLRGAQAVITDPPYGILEHDWDVPIDWETLAWDALRPGGFVCSFGLLMTLAPVCFALEVAGFRREAEMVWSRGTLGTGGDRFGRSHELFAVYYKPPRQAPRVDRVRVPYAPASKPSPSHQRHPLGAAPGSIWYVHETSGSYATHDHETAKPLPLMARLVDALSDPGDTIIDPFAGSGTTLRAAKDLGRRAIGVETREQFCEIAARRLAQEVLDFGERVS
jgi:site-specific DNA-methyltransferase (adenine-specific)